MQMIITDEMIARHKLEELTLTATRRGKKIHIQMTGRHEDNGGATQKLIAEVRKMLIPGHNTASLRMKGVGLVSHDGFEDNATLRELVEHLASAWMQTLDQIKTDNTQFAPFYERLAKSFAIAICGGRVTVSEESFEPRCPCPSCNKQQFDHMLNLKDFFDPSERELMQAVFIAQFTGDMPIIGAWCALSKSIQVEINAQVRKDFLELLKQKLPAAKEAELVAVDDRFRKAMAFLTPP